MAGDSVLVGCSIRKIAVRGATRAQVKLRSGRATDLAWLDSIAKHLKVERARGTTVPPRTLNERATERAFHLCYYTTSTESNVFRDRNYRFCREM
jgi:hypothetical protein